MNRDMAERLISYLLDAEESLERASRATSGFAKEERLKFNRLIHELIAGLRSDVWQPIYDAFPDLAPEYESLEPPTIDSELSWDEVRLEPPLSEKDVDDILLPLLKPYWKKVLRVLFEARDSCNLVGQSISYEILAARLRELSDTNQIEGIGDFRMWGFSEVRLKD
jgi:hypothetical protein